jgi:hypothetical protein
MRKETATGSPQIVFTLERDYGNVAFDRRHRLLTTFLYELPFGTGKTFAYNSGLLNTVTGGWQLGGVAVLQSGPFLTLPDDD